MGIGAFQGQTTEPTIEVLVLPRSLRVSLLVAQLIGGATLIRSIAFDRWITVLASLLLLVGATAAQRGRAWGVGLALASAAAFPVAFAIGIAPVWFCVVGVAGALPFALTSRAFARFDKTATTMLATIGIATGAAGAIAWKHVAWSMFEMFPSLWPSLEPQHGMLAALAAVGTVAAVASRPRPRAGGVRVEGAEQWRVGSARAADADVVSEADAADEADSHEARRLRR